MLIGYVFSLFSDQCVLNDVIFHVVECTQGGHYEIWKYQQTSEKIRKLEVSQLHFTAFFAFGCCSQIFKLSSLKELIFFVQFRRNKSEDAIDKCCVCLFVFVLPLIDVINDLSKSQTLFN